jgi:hypothetical protein
MTNVQLAEACELVHETAIRLRKMNVNPVLFFNLFKTMEKKSPLSVYAFDTPAEYTAFYHTRMTEAPQTHPHDYSTFKDFVQELKISEHLSYVNYLQSKEQQIISLRQNLTQLETVEGFIPSWERFS